MTISFDVGTEFNRIDTSSPATFSHAGAASDVRGVLLLATHGVSSTDHIGAGPVTYGGVALTRVQRNVDTATEPGATEIWFLGSGVPQGTQTMSVTCGSTTDDFHFVCYTLLGSADLEIIDFDGIDNDATDPSVTLSYGGRTALAFAALYGGGTGPGQFTVNGNTTEGPSIDFGNFYAMVMRQTTPGSDDFEIGGTAALDDIAFSAVAVSEVLSEEPIEIPSLRSKRIYVMP